ncbi:MAG: hypothetical protein ACFHX7_06955 [Pseudomonadota bacterium]
MITRRERSRGAAVLVFLTIVTLALTTLLVSVLSPNAVLTGRTLENAARLDEAQVALTGYALSQQPPGVLPCPDSDGDGLANPLGAGCVSPLGLLPFRTLNLARMTDRTGASFWYGVEPGYMGTAPGVKNSSVTSTVTLDGSVKAAVVLAPGEPIGSQSRIALNVNDFLEGQNASAPLNVFSALVDDTHNDQVVGTDLGAFWSDVETVVLATTADLLAQYRATCGEFPWAGSFGGPYVSTPGLQAGSVPLDGALPFNWGSPCPGGSAPVPPAWLVVHWRNQLYYRMCLAVEGDCVSISGVPAPGVLLAPGVALAGQVRNTANPTDYFEGDNVSLPDTVFARLPRGQHNATYNDTTRPL